MLLFWISRILSQTLNLLYANLVYKQLPKYYQQSLYCRSRIMKGVPVLQYGNTMLNNLNNLLNNLKNGKDTRDLPKRLLCKDITNVTNKANPEADHHETRPSQQNKAPNFLVNDKKVLKYRSISMTPCSWSHQYQNSRPELNPYSRQISQSMLTNQSKTKVNPLKIPFNISKQINKLILIHHTLRLKQQTLFLTFAYFFQFLQKKVIEQNVKFLAGVACLWIASKYEEVYAPETRFYVKFIKEFGLDRLLEMQAQVLMCLQFNLVRSTPYNFLETLCEQDSNVFSLSNYLLQSCYYKQEQIIENPSTLALTAFKIAQYIFKQNSKPNSLEKMIEFSKQQMEGWFKKVCQILSPNYTNSIFLKRKFADTKFQRVSKIQLLLK